MPKEILEEVIVSSPATLEEAKACVEFFWYLARHQNQKVLVQVWNFPKFEEEKKP